MRKMLIGAIMIMFSGVIAVGSGYSQDGSTSAVGLGDSITFMNHEAFWLDHGVPGATVEYSSSRLPELLPKDTEQVWLMAGINDLLQGKPADEIVKAMASLIDAIQQQDPGSCIFIQSILPTRKGNKVNEEINQVNSGYEQMADIKNNIFYIDLHSHFCESDGETALAEYIPDLHPNKAGDEYWNSLILQWIQENLQNN